VTNMDEMFFSAISFTQDLCPWKDAPAVLFNFDSNMFFDCPGGPNTGNTGFFGFGLTGFENPDTFSFDASQCPVSYFEI